MGEHTGSPQGVDKMVDALFLFCHFWEEVLYE